MCDDTRFEIFQKTWIQVEWISYTHTHTLTCLNVNCAFIQNVKNKIRWKNVNARLPLKYEKKKLCMVGMSAYLFTWMQNAAGKYSRIAGCDRSDKRRGKKTSSKGSKCKTNTFKHLNITNRNWVGAYCCRCVSLSLQLYKN